VTGWCARPPDHGEPGRWAARDGPVTSRWSCSGRSDDESRRTYRCRSAPPVQQPYYSWDAKGCQDGAQDGTPRIRIQRSERAAI